MTDEYETKLLANKSCQECGAPYYSKLSRSRFCRPACFYVNRTKNKKKFAARACEKCAKAFVPNKVTSRFCSRRCSRLVIAPLTNASRKVVACWYFNTRRGYVQGHVWEGTKKRHVQQHRYFMEQHLGRRLKPKEVVHHRDGNPRNNDLSNLQVMSLSDHTKLHAAERRETSHV